MEGEYRYDPLTFSVTDAMKADYDRLGYVLVRGLLDAEEMKMLHTSLEGPGGIMDHAFMVDDGLQKQVGLCIWSHPGNDVTGMLARAEKTARTAELLMGHGEVYHYHSKVTFKAARSGGSWRWHQDYGYWYNNGCLFPYMCTAYIGYDKSGKENGGLQILPGSHKAGRVDHDREGGQFGVNEERVQQLAKVCPVMSVELDPGDALFFDCNLLHKSDANESDRRRWSFLLCYNTKVNNPVKQHHHPCYTPLDIVPNSAIKTCTNYTDMTGKEFMNPDTDQTTRYNPNSAVQK
ncbi:uncharacterized protein LOC106174586 [Lingula anatina]|uniref:Uncharacterized protein LOC106174586 n=1 Tax=Lingula anatina TaxID=7574 RepID=A0A1S3JND4_LINAN|nr:uncharacterized protein LOC106174586 [Lingula anatina]|eukprot:XP_013411661.1 uncharacterized protein LOC106174586 [Lingula anatina]